jgi:MFS family permease
MRKPDPHTFLSTLWLFILLNVIFRDFHQLGMAWYLESLLTGYQNGVRITEEIMLMAGVLVQVPIGMVLLSHLLTREWLRRATFVAVPVTAAGMMMAPPTDKDDVLHLIIELAAMTVILWVAWRWPAGQPVAGRP